MTPQESTRDHPRADRTPARTAVRDPWERFGWLMAVVWLFFLIYPVMALLNSQAHIAWIVVGWAAVVVFLLLYVGGFIHGVRSGAGLSRPSTRWQWCAFAGLILCVIVSIPAEGGSALSFLPFIMSFASYGLNRIAHWATTIGAFVVTAIAVLLLPDGSEYVSVLVIIVLLGAVNTVSTWLMARSSEASQLSLELATSEGREAIARDVHDLIGHSLTVVGLKAQLVRRLIDTDPERAKAELADIEALTAEAIAGVRSTVSEARTSSLDTQLATSRDALRAADIEMRVEGETAVLSPAQALTASWILREATTNTLRHASARRVIVQLAPGRLVVRDDGTGPGGREGNGIRGMRERAAAASAALAVAADPAGGTRVEVTW